jgi:sugar phosphate isomerase/epimerase
MQTRREFLGCSAATLAALGLGRTAYAKTPKARPDAFGVQLYTVRDLMKTDPAGTLAAVRKIGYRTVETYSALYGKTPAKDLRAMILDAGLEVPSAHFSYADFGNRMDYAKELGVKYVVCGNTPGADDHSTDGFKRTAHQYNLWGEQAKATGLQFGFHNHNAEFAAFDNGVTGMETLLAETDPKLVRWQMDCYWVTQAGQDPVTLLKRYANCMQTIHVKDRKPDFPFTTSGPSSHFTEAGKGTLDWPAIWAAATADGVRQFFVEQDTTEIPPLDSLKISYDYLSTHI